MMPRPYGKPRKMGIAGLVANHYAARPFSGKLRDLATVCPASVYRRSDRMNLSLFGAIIILLWVVILLLYFRTSNQHSSLHDEIEALNAGLDESKK